MFSRITKTVGSSGMPMLANVTDGGKTNQNGRISYSALLPHRNPVLCTIFAKGALFLHRFLIMKVTFPDLLEPKERRISSNARRSVRATTRCTASRTTHPTAS